MVTNFSFQKNGLSVSFRDLSTGVPDGSTYHWDFGDFKGSEERNITHEYESSGFYIVTLKITAPAVGEEEPQVGEKQLRLGISDMSKTQLSDSIYNLINSYIPESLLPYLSDIDKQAYIEKWQLYIQPLVCRPCGKEIPLEEYNNELAYEALENQLIMELAAYDFMSVQVANMVKAQAQSILENNTTSSSGGSEPPDGYQGDVKKIQTGPTQVEYFNPNEDESDLASNIIKALGPGGLLDMMKENLCMLAGRLDIYLPICERPTRVVVPKAVNKRIKGPLSGPDPFSLLK